MWRLRCNTFPRELAAAAGRGYGLAVAVAVLALQLALVVPTAVAADVTLDVSSCSHNDFLSSPQRCESVVLSASNDPEGSTIDWIGGDHDGTGDGGAGGAFNYYLSDVPGASANFLLREITNATYDIFASVPAGLGPYDEAVVYTVCVSSGNNDDDASLPSCDSVTVNQTAEAGGEAYLGVRYLEANATLNVTVQGSAAWAALGHYVYIDYIKAMQSSHSPSVTPSPSVTASTSASESETTPTASVTPSAHQEVVGTADGGSTAQVAYAGTWIEVDGEVGVQAFESTEEGAALTITMQLTRDCSAGRDCAHTLSFYNGGHADESHCGVIAVEVRSTATGVVYGTGLVDQSISGGRGWVEVGHYELPANTDIDVVVRVPETCSGANVPLAVHVDAISFAVSDSSASVSPSRSFSASLSVEPSASVTPSTSPSPSRTPSPSASPSPDLIIDVDAPQQAGVTIEPAWCWSAADVADAAGGSLLVDLQNPDEPCHAHIEAAVEREGAYAIYVSHPPLGDLLSAHASVTVEHAIGRGVQANSSSVQVDLSANDDGGWQLVGIYYIERRFALTMSNADKEGGRHVVLDAIRLSAAPSVVAAIDIDAGAPADADGEQGWTLGGDGCTSSVVAEVEGSAGAVRQLSCDADASASLRYVSAGTGVPDRAIAEARLLCGSATSLGPVAAATVAIEAQATGGDGPTRNLDSTTVTCDGGWHTVALVLAHNGTQNIALKVMVESDGEALVVYVDRFLLHADRCGGADNGGCAHTCRNVLGARQCSCDEGFALHQDGSCTDIDECALYTDGCEGMCSNTAGGYTCSCGEGLAVAYDGKQCVANLLDNGGFEDGSAEGWSVAVDGGATFAVSESAAYGVAGYSSYGANLTGSGGEGESPVGRVIVNTSTAAAVMWSDVTNYAASWHLSTWAVNVNGENGDGDGDVLYHVSAVYGNGTIVAEADFLLVRGDGWTTQSWSFSLGDDGEGDGRDPSAGLLTLSFEFSSLAAGTGIRLDEVFVNQDRCADADSGGCDQECITLVGRHECACVDGSQLARDGKKCISANLVINGDQESIADEHVWQFVVGASGAAARNASDERYAAFEGRRGSSIDVSTAPTDYMDVFLAPPSTSSVSLPDDAALTMFWWVQSPTSKSDTERGVVGAFLSETNGEIVSSSVVAATSEWTQHSVDVAADAASDVSFALFFPSSGSFRVDSFYLDVNECGTDNGGCDHTCTNTEGGYDCSCDAGYVLVNGHGCSDIDECQVANGGCDDLCVNEAGSHSCRCTLPGVELATDGRTCRMPNVIVNGDFEDSTSVAWVPHFEAGVAGSISTESTEAAYMGNAGALVVIGDSAPGSSPEDVQLLSGTIVPSAGTNVLVSFWAKCSENGASFRFIWQDAATANEIAGSVVTCSNEWTKHDSLYDDDVSTLVVASDEPVAAVRVGFQFGGTAGTFAIDHVVVEETDDATPPEVASVDVYVSTGRNEVVITFTTIVYVSDDAFYDGVVALAESNSTSAEDIATAVVNLPVSLATISGNGSQALTIALGDATVNEIRELPHLARSLESTFLVLARGLVFNDASHVNDAATLAATESVFDFQGPTIQVIAVKDSGLTQSVVGWDIVSSEPSTLLLGEGLGGASGLNAILSVSGVSGSFDLNSFTADRVSDRTYRVTVTSLGATALNLTVASGAMVDAFGNVNSEEVIGESTVDLVPPVATIKSSVAGVVDGDVVLGAAGVPIGFLVTFDEPVVGFGLTNADVVGCSNVTAAVVGDGVSDVYMVECVPELDNNDTSVVTLRLAGAVADVAGNYANLADTTPAFSLIVDAAAPVPILSSARGSTHKPTDINTITVTFDEPVAQLTAADLVFDAGATDAVLLVDSFRPMPLVSEVVSDAGAAHPGAGGGWVYHSSGCPFCLSAQGGDYYSTYLPGRTLTFELEVPMAARYRLATHKVADDNDPIHAYNFDNDEHEWTITQAHAYNITVTDVAGASYRVTFDVATATPSEWNDVGTFALRSGRVSVSITSPDLDDVPCNPDGLGRDRTQDRCSVANVFADAVRLSIDDTRSYEVEVANVVSEGTYTISVPTGDATINGVTDGVGNQALGGTLSVSCDETPPTVSLTSSVDSAYAPIKNVNVTITFSEPMADFDTSNIAFDNGGTGAALTVVGGPAVFVAMLDAQVSGDWSVTVTTAADAAGNLLEDSATVSGRVQLAPRVLAGEISFEDVDPTGGVLAGHLTFEPAEDESSVSGYRLYLANGTTVGRRRGPAVHEWRIGEEYTVDIEGLSHLSDEWYFQVVAFCDVLDCTGDSDEASSTEFKDRAVPPLTVSEETFLDEDKTEGGIKGMLTFATFDFDSPANMRAAVEGVSIFAATGNEESDRMTLVANFTTIDIIVEAGEDGHTTGVGFGGGETADGRGSYVHLNPAEGWSRSTRLGGYSGEHFYHNQGVVGGGWTATFHLDVPCTGNYTLSLWYPESGSGLAMARNVPVTVRHAGGAKRTFEIDQSRGGGDWLYIGTYNLAAGEAASVELATDNTGGLAVTADALRFTSTSLLGSCGMEQEVGGTIASLWGSDQVEAEESIKSAQHMLQIVAYNKYGYSHDWRTLSVVDRKAPPADATVTDIAFYDTNRSIGVIAGEVKFTAAILPSAAANVEGYEVRLVVAGSDPDSAVEELRGAGEHSEAGGSMKSEIGWSIKVADVPVQIGEGVEVNGEASTNYVANIQNVLLPETVSSTTWVLQVHAYNAVGTSDNYTSIDLVDRAEQATDRAALDIACARVDLFPPKQGWCDPEVDLCHWEGIGCDETGAVTSIALEGGEACNSKGTCARGTIPAELAQLESLTSIELGGNHIHGTLPSSLASLLPRLEILDVSDNFVSALPEVDGDADAEALRTYFAEHPVDLSGNLVEGFDPRGQAGLPGGMEGFVDTDGVESSIAGVLRFRRATDEHDLVNYIVVLGLSDETVVSEPLAIVHKGNVSTESDSIVEAGIPSSPLGNATHFLVYAGTAAGEPRGAMVKHLIVDLVRSTPTDPPRELVFVDRNYLENVLLGDVCFLRAEKERGGTSPSITGYLLFFASGPNAEDRIGGYTHSLVTYGTEDNSKACIVIDAPLELDKAVTYLHVAAFNDASSDSLTNGGAFASLQVADSVGGCTDDTECMRGTCSQVTNTCVCDAGFSGPLCKDHTVEVSLTGKSRVRLGGRAKIRFG